MRAFVTGASGFIGRHLVARLIAFAEVDALVRPGRSAPPGARRIEGDIGDPSSLQAAGEADVVFHLAAEASPAAGQADPVRLLRTNLHGTLNVWSAARRDARFVFASTAQVYAPSGAALSEDAPTRPSNAYGASKLSAEWALRALEADAPRTVILRLFNVYGAGQSPVYVLGRTLEALRAGRRVELHAADPIRDFIHVEDAVGAFVAAARAPGVAGSTFNVATGRPASIGEVAALASEAAGMPPPVFRGVPAGPSMLVGDPSEAKRVLGWEAAMTIEEGIRREVAVSQRSLSSQR